MSTASYHQGWRAADMQADGSWLVALADQDQKEIRAAIRASEDQGQAIHHITRESFPLPGLAPRLEQVRKDLLNGRGFALLRGLDLAGLSRAEVMRAYFGLGAFLGVARPQNGKGHLIGHVRDLGEDPKNPATRIYRTAARQRFHVDSCDLVGLLCLQKSKTGGASSLVSSLAVVDEIKRRRPDLYEVLEQPFIYDRKDEVPQGKGAWYPIPIVHHAKGKTSVYFARDFIESAQARFTEIPRLTALQIEALDMMEQLAESDAFRLSIAFEPGDIQFVHNHVILHAREAYEDWAQPEKKRHLLRLWLSAHGGRPLPPVFAERYGPLIAGQPRGGIFVPGVAPQIALEAG